MTEDEILLVASLAGAAVFLTLLDLLLSLLRHKRRTQVLSLSTRLDQAQQDRVAADTKSEWIRKRLAAIQNASNETSSPPPAPDMT